MELREAIHHEVCTRGFDPVRGTFTQSYGSQEVDTALLLIPRVGFLSPDDPRVLGTVEAVRQQLATPEDSYGATRPQEITRGSTAWTVTRGAFLLCSFWMVDALAPTGRLAKPTVSSTGSWPCAPTSACSPRSTTTSPDGNGETSRRRTATSG